MKIIKTYKLFIEEVITTVDRLLEPKMDDFLKKIELYQCGDHIWAIKIDDSYSRAMVFLRPQEYYESAFEEIIGKQFKFSKYMDRYKQEYGKQEFTYGDDWAGFNIPSNVLEECMFNITDEINTYDKIMLSIISSIKETEGSHNYYLLGVNELQNDILKHEFAHAMFYTIPEYKNIMVKINSECDPVVKRSMYRCIFEYGYADHVLPDELQAYMSTGLGEKMIEMDIPNIDEQIDIYEDVFNKFYSKSLYTEPKVKSIKWNI
jgi:hypothetical protein